MSCRTLTVGDLVDSGAANIQTGPFGTQLKASDYVDEGTPVINVRNIGFGGLRPEKFEFVTEETAERLISHLLEPQDIVFGRKGAVDRHLYVNDEQEHWVQGSDCIRLRFLTDEVVPRFVSYFFLTDTHQKWMLAQAGNKATMASLNHDIIKRIALRLPSPDVQGVIADILSAYDNLIENNRRRMVLLEEAARQLYREWFVRLRFPGHEHTRITNGVAEGWQRQMLAELCDFIDYGYTASAELDEVGPKFLRITDIVPDIIDWTSVPYCWLGPESLTLNSLTSHPDLRTSHSRNSVEASFWRLLSRMTRAVTLFPQDLLLILKVITFPRGSRKIGSDYCLSLLIDGSHLRDYLDAEFHRLNPSESASHSLS